MSLEIGSFVVWSVWADQYWHLCFSWTWWQGGELEHQWRLRVLSQRNCCGVVDVGLLEVGGSFMESQVHHLWSCGFMCCWERNETFMHYFATYWYSTQMGRLSRHALSQILLYFPSYQNVFILPLLTHLSYPTGYTTVFFFFFLLLFPRLLFFHTTAWPNYVLNQTPHVDYEWEMLNDKLSSLGTASWKLSHIVLERVG